MKEIEVKIKKLHPDAIIPKYAHDGDVAMDMTAISVEYDIDNDMYIYHTGLAFDLRFKHTLVPEFLRSKANTLAKKIGIQKKIL